MEVNTIYTLLSMDKITRDLKYIDPYIDTEISFCTKIPDMEFKYNGVVTITYDGGDFFRIPSYYRIIDNKTKCILVVDNDMDKKSINIFANQNSVYVLQNNDVGYKRIDEHDLRHNSFEHALIHGELNTLNNIYIIPRYYVDLINKLKIMVTYDALKLTCGGTVIMLPVYKIGDLTFIIYDIKDVKYRRIVHFDRYINMMYFMAPNQHNIIDIPYLHKLYHIATAIQVTNHNAIINKHFDKICRLYSVLLSNINTCQYIEYVYMIYCELRVLITRQNNIKAYATEARLKAYATEARLKADAHHQMLMTDDELMRREDEEAKAKAKEDEEAKAKAKEDAEAKAKAKAKEDEEAKALRQAKAKKEEEAKAKAKEDAEARLEREAAAERERVVAAADRRERVAAIEKERQATSKKEEDERQRADEKRQSEAEARLVVEAKHKQDDAAARAATTSLKQTEAPAAQPSAETTYKQLPDEPWITYLHRLFTMHDNPQQKHKAIQELGTIVFDKIKDHDTQQILMQAVCNIDKPSHAEQAKLQLIGELEGRDQPPARGGGRYAIRQHKRTKMRTPPNTQNLVTLPNLMFYN